MIAKAIALVYCLLYPHCIVSVYDASVSEFVALPNFTQTWSTCAGKWRYEERGLRIRMRWAPEISVDVCGCEDDL